jgi:enolase
MKITKVLGYQVLDSRGRPTVAASITLENGATHTARVPSGASTGKHEAKELRDGDSAISNKFYSGKSVNQAASNINTVIAPALENTALSLSAVDQKLLHLDPTSDHSTLGANATLAVSLAAANAEAALAHNSLARFFSHSGPLEIPMPMVNILSGGAHAGKTLDIQDVLVVPVGASTFAEAISWAVAIREAAATLGAKQGKITHLVADEGGIGIPFSSIFAACTFVEEVISSVGFTPGKDIYLALDIAATQFFSEGTYHLAAESKSFSSSEFVTHINELVSRHPIISIEDPFAEDDWDAWQRFTSLAPQGIQILGDDLLTTNQNRLDRAISERSANAILIKPNQNGLVTETQKVLLRAQSKGFATVVSARSGETEDSWLADLAVGWKAQQIKVGSTHGSERTAKWNRLLELEATENTIFANPFKKSFTL